jgi:hypothetical protein
MRKAGIIDGIGEKAFLQEIERKGFIRENYPDKEGLCSGEFSILPGLPSLDRNF